ncbi:MAG TPA: exodeoxyribonuclease VII small subunit [Rhizobiales bacterium]|nr:exodeoxyribonuclease VII small subunit [Hyphomicrobiales bacterium]
MAKDPQAGQDISSMSFEKALAELEGIVRRLEAGQVELEESIRIYERGEALKSRCNALLKQAEARIEKITLKDGRAETSEALEVE